MEGQTQSAMSCAQFEALLADALDGALGAETLQNFEAHKAACQACGLMFAEAQAGMRWLTSLEEVQPPAGLVRNILIATSGLPATERGGTWWERLRPWLIPDFRPVWRTAMQPRFAMSFAMAFFSLTLVMNMAGVKISDLRNLDLRPSAIRNAAVRTYHTTTARVVRYYENLRFVYEIESRVRDLRQTSAPAEEETPSQKAAPDNTSENPRAPEGSEQENRNMPRKRQDQRQNYAQEMEEPVLAMLLPRGRLPYTATAIAMAILVRGEAS